VPEVGADQVDRADVRVEPLRDEIDDVAERLAEVVRTRDDPRDVREQTFAVGNGRALRDDGRTRLAYPAIGGGAKECTLGSKGCWEGRQGLCLRQPAQ
jgi:hypothetical protein